jgi:hypothetical protein
MSATPELVTELTNLESMLTAAIKRLTGEARPAPAVLDELAAGLVRAHAALGHATTDEVGEPTADRLAVMRLAIAVRERLLVVARLGAGSAWYASLARELEGTDGARGTATYGRTGTVAVRPGGSSIERRA